jgi:hypothetical protein
MVSGLDFARAPRRAPLIARKKGSGYENVGAPENVLVSPGPHPSLPSYSEISPSVKTEKCKHIYTY